MTFSGEQYWTEALSTDDWSPPNPWYLVPVTLSNCPMGKCLCWKKVTHLPLSWTLLCHSPASFPRPGAHGHLPWTLPFGVAFPRWLTPMLHHYQDAYIPCRSPQCTPGQQALHHASGIPPLLAPSLRTVHEAQFPLPGLNPVAVAACLSPKHKQAGRSEPRGGQGRVEGNTGHIFNRC